MIVILTNAGEQVVQIPLEAAQTLAPALGAVILATIAKRQVFFRL